MNRAERRRAARSAVSDGDRSASIMRVLDPPPGRRAVCAISVVPQATSEWFEKTRAMLALQLVEKHGSDLNQATSVMYEAEHASEAADKILAVFDEPDWQDVPAYLAKFPGAALVVLMATAPGR